MVSPQSEREVRFGAMYGVCCVWQHGVESATLPGLILSSWSCLCGIFAYGWSGDAKLLWAVNVCVCGSGTVQSGRLNHFRVEFCSSAHQLEPSPFFCHYFPNLSFLLSASVFLSCKSVCVFIFMSLTGMNMSQNYVDQHYLRDSSMGIMKTLCWFERIAA